MPTLNQSLMSDVSNLGDNATYSTTGNFTVTKTYPNIPGAPSGGHYLGDGIDRYSLQIVWVVNTTLTGTFALQASNDNTNWSQLDLQTVAAGKISGTNTFLWTGYADPKFIRIVFTNTGGAGGTNDFTARIRKIKKGR